MATVFQIHLLLEKFYGMVMLISLKVNCTKLGDRVTALPEDAFFDKRELGKGGKAQIHGNQDPYDLISLLNNVQQSVASKLAVTSVHEY